MRDLFCSVPLTRREKFGYGLGDMASNFYLGFFSLYLLYYYTDIYGLAPAIVGTMLLISKIIDAISDPIMGIICDRTQSQAGRYRPYLLWGAIPYGILGCAVFFGPNFSDTGKLIYAYITYIGVMLAFTVMNVPYSALLAVLSPSSEERAKATTYRFAFAAGGGLLVAMFATPLVRILGQGDDATGFKYTIIIFSAISICLFWLTYASTKERISLPKHKNSIKSDIKTLLKNTSWVVLAITSIFVLSGLAARFASIIYLVKYYMSANADVYFLFFDKTAFFSSIGLVGQILGSMCAYFFSRYSSKHKLVITMCVLHALLLLIGYMTPPDMYIFTVFLHFLGMFTFGVVIALLFAMFSDCADFCEWKTGKRASGLVVSASIFALKIGSAFGAALPAFVLSYVNFKPNEVSSDIAMHGILIMATIIPAVSFIVGALVMYFYKIDNSVLKKIEVELRLKRNNNPS